MHQVQLEVRRYMTVLKVEPAVARARSGAVASTSETIIKPQFWLEGASVITALTFSRQLANILVALLTPAALVALVLGIWRVCMDLGWAGAFLIAGGFFSHWQVWIALSIGLKMLSSTLIAWGARTEQFSEEN